MVNSKRMKKYIALNLVRCASLAYIDCGSKICNIMDVIYHLEVEGTCCSFTVVFCSLCTAFFSAVPEFMSCSVAAEIDPENGNLSNTP